MSTVTLPEAESKLGQLVALIESGREKEVLILSGGKLAARLVPPKRPSHRHSVQLGLARDGSAPMKLEDFNKHNDEIANLFSGNGP